MYEPRGPDWENAGWIATIVFFVLLLASAAQRAVRMRRGGRGS
jgi:hypothetical protein